MQIGSKALVNLPGAMPRTLVLILAALLVLRPIDSFDIWWHLNSGLWMLGHGELMDHDVWSYTVPGREWINVAWLFQLMIAIIYTAFGDWGLLLVKYLLVFTVYYLFWLNTSGRAGFAAYLLAMILMMPYMVGHFHLRPHMIELMLIASVIILSRQRWRLHHVMIGVFLVMIWANTHASAIVGATALSVQAVFGQWHRETRISKRVLVAAVFLIPLVLTPYGISLIELLLAHGDSESIDYYISEWVIEGLFPEMLWAMVAIVFIGGISKQLKLSPIEWYLLVFFLLYALQFKRFELELSVVLLAPVSIIMHSGIRLIQKTSGRRVSMLIVFLFILAHVALYYVDSREVARFLRYGIPVQSVNYPSISAQQLSELSDQMDRKVRVLNDYAMGGYLAFATDSRASVLVDGRMSTVYPERLVIPKYEEKAEIRDMLADRYEVDAMLFSQSTAAKIGHGGAAWRRVGYDSASVLYVRESLANQYQIPRISYDPAVYHSGYSPEQNAQYSGETLRYSKKYPDNPVALNHLAVFGSSMVGNREQAIELLNVLAKADEINPHNKFSRATMALLYSRWQTFDKSFLNNFIEVLPAADDMGAEVNDAYFSQFALQLIELGLPRAAKDYLYPESINRRRRMDERPGVWMERAILHHELGESGKVGNCLEIARELIKDEDLSALKKLDSLRISLSM